MITNATAKSRAATRTSAHTPAAQAVRYFLLPFMICFSIAFVSGLFYYLVPRSWNWTASQAALWIHLITGILSFLFLIPYVLSHYKTKGESAINLILVWRAFRRNENQSDWSYQQRIFGHILNWFMALLGLSGFIFIIPSLLWMSGVVWMAGYPAYQIANITHLGLALLSLAFIGFHVARRRKRTNQR